MGADEPASAYLEYAANGNKSSRKRGYKQQVSGSASVNGRKSALRKNLLQTKLDIMQKLDSLPEEQLQKIRDSFVLGETTLVESDKKRAGGRIVRNASEYGLVNDVEELNNSVADLGANSQEDLDEKEGSLSLVQ